MGFEIGCLAHDGRFGPSSGLEIPALQQMSRIMFLRAVLGLVVVAASLSAEPASAVYTPAQRAAIRATPITQRPYRPGHFYGNTVRTLNRFRAY